MNAIVLPRAEYDAMMAILREHAPSIYVQFSRP